MREAWTSLTTGSLIWTVFYTLKVLSKKIQKGNKTD